MPKAIASPDETVKHELKSLPGGFILCRRLSYGEKLHRRAMVSGMKIEAGKKNKDFAGEMQLVNAEATAFDFQKCIVDHNLFKDDEEQVKFDLTSIGDIKMLDPRVGEEIDQFLSELNNWEDEEDEELGN